MNKLLIVFTLILAAPALAGTKAYTKNNGGGQIVLTDEKCEWDASMLRSYTYTKDHYTEEGCWKDDDLTVYVKWDIMGEKRYAKKLFKVSNPW